MESFFARNRKYFYSKVGESARISFFHTELWRRVKSNIRTGQKWWFAISWIWREKTKDVNWFVRPGFLWNRLRRIILLFTCRNRASALLYSIAAFNRATCSRFLEMRMSHSKTPWHWKAAITGSNDSRIEETATILPLSAILFAMRAVTKHIKLSRVGRVTLPVKFCL